MALSFNTPGVYIEEIPVFAPSVAPVDTAIPAFIGYTEKPTDYSLLYQPTRITSLVEYENIFGKAYPEPNIKVTIADTTSSGTLVSRSISAAFIGAGRSSYKLYNSVQMYFANGGGPCYIVSVGTYGGTPDPVIKGDGTTFTTPAGGMLAGINSLLKEDEPTLLVFPDAISLASQTDYAAVYQQALSQCAKLQDRFTVGDLFGNSIDSSAVASFRTDLGANNLKYGAVYTPFVNTGLSYTYVDTDVDVAYTIDGTAVGAVNTLDDFTTTGSYPNLELYNQSISAIALDLPVQLPPSGIVVGIYASVDRDRGVWKAPANVSVNGVISPTIPITNSQQGSLNVDTTGGKSINVIRTFVGRGTLIWGARTLAGNDNEWRYIPVRRLFIMAEESIKKASEFVVFEPNNKNTWMRVKSTISNFLTDLWKQGALAGDKAEQAYFVKIGLNETMTAQDILEGKLIVQVGLAAVRPAEFIVLQFMHKLQEA